MITLNSNFVSFLFSNIFTVYYCYYLHHIHYVSLRKTETETESETGICIVSIWVRWAGSIFTEHNLNIKESLFYYPSFLMNSPLYIIYKTSAQHSIFRYWHHLELENEYRIHGIQNRFEVKERQTPFIVFHSL